MIRCPDCMRIRQHGEWVVLDRENKFVYNELLADGTIKEEYILCPRCREAKQQHPLGGVAKNYPSKTKNYLFLQLNKNPIFGGYKPFNWLGK